MKPESAKKTLLLSLVVSAMLVAFSSGDPNEKTRRFIGFGAIFLLASVGVEAAPALGAAIAIITTVSLLLQHGGNAFNKAANITKKPWVPLQSKGSDIVAPGTVPAGATGGVDAGGNVKGKGKIIGRPYEGTHTLGNWESDNAVDISLPVNTQILAPFAGQIGHDRNFGRFDSRARFHGMRLYLQGNRGEAAFFQHLEKYAPGIQPGVTVKIGDTIGYSGTGNGVPHLHFAVRPPASPFSYQKKTYR